MNEHIAHQYPTAKPFRGVPSFFRALCLEASGGGGASYRNAGYQFAASTDRLEPYDYESVDDFGQRVDLLRSLLEAGNRKGVLHWFRDEYPNCLRLVPKRRHQVFLDGVFAAYDDGKVGL